MILKRNFHPLKVLAYVWQEVLFAFVWSVVVWVLFTYGGVKSLALNFTPIGVLGSALAIFVAFRNNSAYGRWWEARQIWGSIVNASRTFARLVVTFTDSHAHQANYDRERSERFKKEMVYRQIAWAHALRLHLRRQNDWEILQPFLPAQEYSDLVAKQNKPNYLQQLMGRRIYQAMGDGTLGGFDSFQMEGQLASLANYLGNAERIKDTPLPRQYDFFTRLFVYTFATLLPLGLLSFFNQENSLRLAWAIVPLATVIAAVFTIMEKTGAANEDPFENRTTDVPMTSLCNTIERDLREQLGETDLPAKLEPAQGYLF
ncbi:MAG: bestrophin family ion channel [Saprospiraceae bacterium]